MRKNSGQMLLIVVLTMVIALTVGLAVVSRSVVNIKVSKQNEESQRSLQAAEAGIELALKQLEADPNSNLTLPTSLSNNANVTVNIDTNHSPAKMDPSTRLLPLNAGNDIDQDKGFDVWLSDYPSYTSSFTNILRIYWAIPNPSNPPSCAAGSGDTINPALEVLLLSGTAANPTMTKFLFDPCNAINRIQGASNPTGTSPSSGPGSISIGGVTTGYPFADVSITSGLIMKIIPLFNSAKITIHAPSAPSLDSKQGAFIESTGTSGDTTRKVTYFVTYPQIPIELFPYALLSQNP